MRYAILADVHGNLEALESVLIALDREGVDRVVVLGDLVGYGPDPVACIYRLQEAEAVCLLGNHDEAVLDPDKARELNSMARDTVLHSRQLLGPEEEQYLRSFTHQLAEEYATLSHANPIEPRQWQSLFLFEHIDWCLQNMPSRLAFVGHTHHQGIWCRTDTTSVPLTSSEVAVGRHRYLVNAGSVGQPRDGDPRAGFALWDVEREHVRLCRVEYPWQRTQAKIRALDWPTYVAERLESGE